MLRDKTLYKGRIRSTGEKTDIIEYGHNTHWLQFHLSLISHCGHLLNKVNCRLKIEAEVDHVPFEPFVYVLLLLPHEHGVIE